MHAFTIACAIVSISSSVPTPLMALQPQRMKRVFSFVYPFVVSIRSMLGQKGAGPLLSASRKATPVISQFPVQRARAHSSSNLNTQPFSLARNLADCKR